MCLTTPTAITMRNLFTIVSNSVGKILRTLHFALYLLGTLYLYFLYYSFQSATLTTHARRLISGSKCGSGKLHSFSFSISLWLSNKFVTKWTWLTWLTNFYWIWNKGWLQRTKKLTPTANMMDSSWRNAGVVMITAAEWKNNEEAIVTKQIGIITEFFLQ